MALTEKLTAIADAIRGKTGGTDSLTLDAMAAAISTLETGGGGGNMESGELTTTSANFYGFSIPVSSKKTHAVIYPKSFADAATTHNTGRISCIFVAEGNGHAEVRLGGAKMLDSATHTIATFHDTSIVFSTANHAPYNIGEYDWFAW